MEREGNLRSLPSPLLPWWSFCHATQVGAQRAGLREAQAMVQVSGMKVFQIHPGVRGVLSGGTFIGRDILGLGVMESSTVLPMD